jgi:S1-C subfamily serine protease
VIQGLEELVARVRSGVVHLITHKGKERLGSGTGFFVSGKLITNNHVAFGIPPEARLAVRFHDTPPAHADYSFTPLQIQRAMCSVSDEGEHDYVILDLPELLEHNPYEFQFADHEPKIGQSIAYLGYPRAHWHLTCRSGIISAIYPRGVTTLLQIDASIDPSNSGAPLFNESGDIVGIITRTAAGLSSTFDDLLTSFDDAISVLSGISFFATASQAMISIQQQMKEVARQLQKSTSMETGSAIACDKIKNETLSATRPGLQSAAPRSRD